ncbi:MAG: hypothetical protein SGILL_009022 [Bacillariaceae sp.]
MSDNEEETPPPAEEETFEDETPAEPEPPKTKKSSWEKELVKRLEVTWGDAKAILQIAKDDLGINQKDYPEEKKEEVFAKCDEIGESFEKTPRVSVPATTSLKKVEESSADSTVPEPETWEDEVTKKYECSSVDASTLLQMAKHDLDIEETEYPEDKKEEIMDKVDELTEGFSFAPNPEPTTIVFVRDPWADELSKELNCRISNAKQLLLLAKRDLGLAEDEPAPVAQKGAIFEKAREIAKTYDLTPRDVTNDEVDQNKVIVAVIIALFVIAAIIGVSVGVTRNNRNNEEPAPTEAPGNVPPGGIDPDCDQVEKKFSVPGVVVGMAVTSDISDVEISYAASVLQKTYTSLLQGAVADADDFCDPFCRMVTGVEVIDSVVAPDSNSSYIEEGCDSVLAVTYEVTGTFVGCEDTEWPGLVATPATFRRKLQEEANSLLRGGFVRWLQPEMCRSCPDDASNLGNVVPSGDEVIEIMDPFVSVLPQICALTDFVIIDEGGELTGEPPAGGWTNAECVVTVAKENCTDFMEANIGVIPCECDGQCIHFADGGFSGCTADGTFEDGLEVEAAGCTFADDATGISGFLCSP